MSFVTTALDFATSGGSRKLLLILGGMLLLVLVAAFAAWRGYHAGYGRADAERRAEVAELRGEHSLALAIAEGQAREIIQAETRRANEAERQYLAAKKTIAAERRTITNARIRNANRDLDPDGLCRFGPEWVRLFNQAAGAGDGSDHRPAADSGLAGEAGAPEAAQAGVLPGGPAVTGEDVLAWMRDYGPRCQDIEAQLGGLIEFEQGRVAGEVQPQ